MVLLHCSDLLLLLYGNNSAICVTLQSAVLLGILVLQQTYSLINHMEMWPKHSGNFSIGKMIKDGICK